MAVKELRDELRTLRKESVKPISKMKMNDISAEIDRLYVLKNKPLRLDKSTLDLFYEYYKKRFDEMVKVKGNPWAKIKPKIQSKIKE